MGVVVDVLRKTSKTKRRNASPQQTGLRGICLEFLIIQRGFPYSLAGKYIKSLVESEGYIFIEKYILCGDSD